MTSTPHYYRGGYVIISAVDEVQRGKLTVDLVNSVLS